MFALAFSSFSITNYENFNHWWQVEIALWISPPLFHPWRASLSPGPARLSRLCASAAAGTAGRDHCLKSRNELPECSNLSRSTSRGSCYLIAETQNMLSHLNHGLICNKVSLIFFFFSNVLGILPARRVVLNNLATIEREKETLNKGVKLIEC